MEVVAQVRDVFGLTVSEKKTETIRMPGPHTSQALMHVEALGNDIDILHGVDPCM